MSAKGGRRPDHPAVRALVAVIVTLATLLIVAPVLVWPAVEIATSRTATVHLDGEPVTVIVADTPIRRACGLQGRGRLMGDEGMLFIFDASARLSFGRKSVPFPLEVAFAGKDGEITGISPLDEEHPKAVSPGEALYAVELPPGWSEAHGITEGSRLLLP